MLARCATYVLEGVEARRVTVECDIRPGLPTFTILGLSDIAARELRETVRAAIQNAGYEFPQRRVTFNIAPVSLRRTSPSVTLAVALAVLAASEQLNADQIAKLAVYGELSLSGEVRGLPGTLAAAAEHRSKANGPLLHGGPALPHDLAPAPAVPITHLSDVATIPVDNWYDVFAAPSRNTHSQPDFAEIRGNAQAVFALTVAAAGGHAILLRGAPGSGATMLARRLPSILPELSETQQREVAIIRDAAGLGRDRDRPFRAPHHTISPAGLVGGGSPVHPGEVTLAHRGALYLSDLHEFGRATLEALRGPLSERSVTVVRGQQALRFPADFQLVASTTPCPCGYAGTDRCLCDAETMRRHQRRLSAPLLDRFDIVVDLPARVGPDAEPAASSAELRARVAVVRERQARRDPVLYRDENPDGIARGFLADDAHEALEFAYRTGQLSTRGRLRTLRVAATIADLNGEDIITAAAIRTALAIGPGQLAEARQPA